MVCSILLLSSQSNLTTRTTQLHGMLLASCMVLIDAQPRSLIARHSLVANDTVFAHEGEI